MAEIIPFPKATLKKRMEDSLKSMRESLKDMYKALDKVEKGYKSIEDQTHEMEDSYQDLMIAYIQEVGEDNVPLEWLEFCPYVGMERDPETGALKITLVKAPEKKK